MSQDKRIGIANQIYDQFVSGPCIIYKTTRAGATISLLAESMNRNEKFVCLVPTNRIATNTVIKDSKKYSDLDNAVVIRVPANKECLKNELLCEKYPDLRQLPVLPIADSCFECDEFDKCLITAVVRKPDANGIVLTYKKIAALQLASHLRPNTYAEEVLKVLEKSKNLILDEIHEIQFGDITSVTVYNDTSFDIVNLEKYISIMTDFDYLRRVITQFSLIMKDNTIKTSVHEVLGGAQEEDYWKHHLTKSIPNPSTGVADDGENETKVTLGAYKEIIELTKKRRNYDLEMGNILDLYKMISIVTSKVISINGIRDKGTIKINLSAVDQLTTKMIQSYTKRMQSRNRRILLTSATICSYDYGQLFSGGVKLKKITFGINGDPVNNNSKMLILSDSKKYDAFGRNSRSNKRDEIVSKIISILEIYGDEDCIIVTISEREASSLEAALKAAGHPYEVTYYKDPKMMGISASQRIMIAVGVANKPSNAFDVVTTDTESSKRMLYESIHCDTWQAWSRVKDPNSEVPSIVFALGCTVEECEGLTTWGFDRSIEIAPYIERQKKRITVSCDKGLISKPQIKKCKNFDEMMKEASLHKRSKKTLKNTENLLIYNNIRRFCYKYPKILHSSEEIVKLIINRNDAYAMQKSDGSYIKFSTQVTDETIRKHLKGIITIGAYQFNQENKVKWICFDIDSHPPKNRIESEEDIRKRDEKAEYNRERMCNFLKNANIPFLLEKSGSPHSYHIWVFLRPVDGKKAKQFATIIKKESGINCEVFPKQEGIGKNSYGNLVKVPLATHQKHKTQSHIMVNGKFVREFTDLEVEVLDISGFEAPEEKTVEKKIRPEKHLVRVNGQIKTKIRPCIRNALKMQLTGDSGNFMRVAICREHYNAGVHNPEELTNLFRTQSDFSYRKTKYYIHKVLEKLLPNVKCETLREKGGEFVNCAGCPCTEVTFLTHHIKDDFKIT